MTVPFIVFLPTGEIVRTGFVDAGDLDLQAAAGETALAAEGGDLTHWVRDGVVVERPETGLPPVHTMAPGDWVLPDVPVGTAVLIDGVQVLISNEDGLVLRRAARGICTIELVPPFPYIGATCQLTVTG